MCYISQDLGDINLRVTHTYVRGFCCSIGQIILQGVGKEKTTVVNLDLLGPSGTIRSFEMEAPNNGRASQQPQL